MGHVTIAIGLSKARRAGVKLPPPKGTALARKTAASRSSIRRPSSGRSRATSRALRREGARQLRDGLCQNLREVWCIGAPVVAVVLPAEKRRRLAGARAAPGRATLGAKEADPPSPPLLKSIHLRHSMNCPTATGNPDYGLALIVPVGVCHLCS